MWFVINPDRHLIFDIISLLLDKIVMPLMFFIAGYFSLYSIQKTNVLNFIKKRLKRLGIPLLLGLIFIAPIMVYIRHLFRNDINQNYFEYWYSTYFLKEIDSVHLWFLYTLLLFTFIFAILYYLKKDFFLNKTYGGLKLSFTKNILLSGILISFLFFIVNLFILDIKWITIGEFGILQPTRFVVYISLFFLGVIAFKKNFFSIYFSSDKLILWTIFTSIIVVATLLLYYFFYPDVLTVNFLKLINAILFVYLNIGLLMMLLKLFHKYINSNAVIWRKLSKNSYTIYVIHYPFVLFLQYYMLDFSFSPFIKFGIVFLISLVASYLVSEYFIHKIPYLNNIF